LNQWNHRVVNLPVPLVQEKREPQQRQKFPLIMAAFGIHPKNGLPTANELGVSKPQPKEIKTAKYAKDAE
jgi:hypothetical protein